MSTRSIDTDVIAEIAARLDLRAPNREAVEIIAASVASHELTPDAGMFEGIVDSATGVGKTYILAAGVEYFALARGVRHFAIVVPGSTILSKTVRNFTLGDSKSILDAMRVRPVVVTAENFATPAMRSAMDDDNVVKLYIFTVQSLLKPTAKAGRRTHAFHEGLGGAFYEQLVNATDIVVFADEHHVYYGDKFRAAIVEMNPMALIGLTATPHKKTPAGQIIYRYPLAAAIADRFVKTPVIVGRKDDRVDVGTKLADGIELLKAKQAAIDDHIATSGAEPINAVMLVVARDIDDAREVTSLLTSDAFDGGAWRDHVLEVHSDAPDEALAALDRVEEPASPVRIIVSVGMLKEGWDVKSVYVIVSLRASVSEILTEQTLGRGLRLPWGQYTDRELLDTLEVVAHERYEDLLKRANILNEAFIDARTSATHGASVASSPSGAGSSVVGGGSTAVSMVVPGVISPGSIGIVDVEERQREADGQRVARVFVPRPDAARIMLPRMEQRAVPATFSLLEVTDLNVFKALGERLASDPDAELQRTKLEAIVEVDAGGGRTAKVTTGSTSDSIEGNRLFVPLDESRAQLAAALLDSEFVEERQQERAGAEMIVDALIAGLGSDAEAKLSAYGAEPGPGCASSSERSIASTCARRGSTPWSITCRSSRSGRR